MVRIKNPNVTNNKSIKSYLSESFNLAGSFWPSRLVADLEKLLIKKQKEMQSLLDLKYNSLVN